MYLIVVETTIQDCAGFDAHQMTTSQRLPITMKSLGLIVIVLLLGLGCSKDSGVQVHPDLAPYLTTFRLEAEKRGVKIDYESNPIGALFISDTERVDLGWCEVDTRSHNTIYINVVFWPAISELGKEKLVFHELGHCILKRSHLETSGTDGVCKSIMHSGKGCADNYDETTRDQYLDELFLRR